MATLQVKGLDDNLYSALRSRAKRDNRSISQEVATIIEDFLAHPAKSSRDTTHAFLELAGSWEDDRPAQEIACEIRKNRRTGRRFA
jgi:plasmid stability protein